MKKILLGLMFVLSIAFSQTSEPLTDLDDLYMSFSAAPRDLPAPGTYIAVFRAIKFWYVTGNQAPDPAQPTTMYANAWYDPERDLSENEIPRVAFNGTPLTVRPGIPGWYYMKRPPDGDENWLSWYAYLGVGSFPKNVIFDSQSAGVMRDYNVPEVARFDVSFPPPYILNISDSFTIGGSSWSYGVRPVAGDFPTPAYGQLKLYPSQTNNGSVFLDIERLYSPGVINRLDEPSHHYLWDVGTYQGLAGFGACNEDKIGFGTSRGTPEKILFIACSVVVKPVSITVTYPE